MKQLVKYQIIISLIILAVYWINYSLTKNPSLAATAVVVAVVALVALVSVLLAFLELSSISLSALSALFESSVASVASVALSKSESVSLSAFVALAALVVVWVTAEESKIKKSFVMLSIVIQIVLILAGFYGIQLIYS